MNSPPNDDFRFGNFFLRNQKLKNQQECITVGCILSTAVAVSPRESASVHAGIPTPPQADPLGADTPLGPGTPLGADTPRADTPLAPGTPLE